MTRAIDRQSIGLTGKVFRTPLTACSSTIFRADISGKRATRAGPADMPQLWIYSAMTDRLRRTENGWRILERRVGSTSINDRLTPGASHYGYVDPYLSPAAAW